MELGRGIRAGLRGCCNLPTGSWEQASPSPFFFLIQINSCQDLLLLSLVIRIVNVLKFGAFDSF